MSLWQVSEEEVTKLLVSGIDPVNEIDPCFAEFTCTPRSLPDDTTPMVRSRERECVSECRQHKDLKRTKSDVTAPVVCLQCVLSMFEDMGFINTYKIDMHTLARSDIHQFICCV